MNWQGIPSRLRLWRLAIVPMLTFAPALSACNRPSCEGLHKPTLSAEAPSITLVEMMDSQPDDPWGLVFALSFEGGGGGVAAGTLLIYTGAGQPASLPLQNAFAASNLDFAATAGRIAVPLTLAQGGVQDDTVVRLGFQIEDAAKRYSNCYTLDLHVDIHLAHRTGGVRPLILWAGACNRVLRPLTHAAKMAGVSL